jgi:hypothetical protein
LQREQVATPLQLVRLLEETLLAVALPQRVRDDIGQRFDSNRELTDEQATSLIHLVMSLPEAQLA